MAAAGFSSEWSPARRALGAGCQQPAKAAKELLDARRGPTTWEQATDGLRKLRAPLERLPPAARRARVPDNGQVLSLPNRKYH